MKIMAYNLKNNMVLFFMLFSIIGSTVAQVEIKELKGTVFGTNSEKPLASAILNLKGTNVSTVTNSEGLFILKINGDLKVETLLVSSIGHKTKEIQISSFTDNEFKIYLDENATQLSEVNLLAFKEAKNLVREVFKSKAKNNQDQSVLMTAFYRETIKRRNTNVSLTEAVVNLYRKSYSSNSRDEIELQIARKSTNYKRLDTLAFKLQGGPFTALYLDIMKYPEYIFPNESIAGYDFSFDTPSTVNDRPVYVVNFKQQEAIESIGYYGKLYIDVESLALTSATYSLILDGKISAKDFLTEKKPRDVVVYPTSTSYKVDYREKDGKWYYGYSSVELTFKVNKRGQLFNQVYSVSSEMAITDWEIYDGDNRIKSKERLRPTMILADRISGFSDPDFWGKYNLIEPEKSIESAIDKIRKKMKKAESGKP
jgi:hypothetical protein